MADVSDVEFLREIFREEETGAQTKRRFDRRDIRVAVDLVPLSDDGPDFASALAGQTRNVSRGGIALVVSEPPVKPRWAVRLDLGSREILIEVVVRHIHRTVDGNFFLSCKFDRRLDRDEPA